ncbi:hypothetical protein [Sphingomonas sp.]|uniref:hypothetical protein n=1 Tax=Sphingomonas sp. TaxID=28214 RepID=UPI0025D7B930|nr:hypothetical protein [Sphingomonas sp.]
MSYAGVIQEIDVVALRGRTISLSGYVRRANPKSTVGVWMLLADENGKRLDYVNSYKMPLAKAGDWGRYETRLALPANAARLKFGAAVFDADGTAWIDDIALSVVPAAPAAPGRAEELSK